MKAAYLADKGETLEPVYKAKEFDNFGNDTLQAYIYSVGAEKLEKLADKINNGEGQSVFKQEKDTIQKIIADDFRRKHASFVNAKPEFADKRVAAYIENRASSSFRIEDFITHAWQMYQDKGATSSEIDRTATSDKLREAVDSKDVQLWVKKQISGMLGEPGIYNGKERFTSAGNSRTFNQLHYPFTVENIVRAMNNASDRGAGVWGAGATGLVATATPDYQSVKDIHKDEKRLQTISDEEYSSALKILDEKVDSVISDIIKRTKHHADNQYEESEIIGSIIMDAATRKKTAAAVINAFYKEGYTISKNTADRVLNLFNEAEKFPTGYFEAKPKRVVGLDEAAAIIAPDDAPADLVSDMKNAGMDVIKYKAGDDADRLEKVNSVNGTKFSREVPEQLKIRTRQRSTELERGRHKVGHR